MRLEFDIICLNNNFRQRKTIKVSKKFSNVAEIYVFSEKSKQYPHEPDMFLSF